TGTTVLVSQVCPDCTFSVHTHRVYNLRVYHDSDALGSDASCNHVSFGGSNERRQSHRGHRWRRGWMYRGIELSSAELPAVLDGACIDAASAGFGRQRPDGNH